MTKLAPQPESDPFHKDDDDDPSGGTDQDVEQQHSPIVSLVSWTKTQT